MEKIKHVGYFVVVLVLAGVMVSGCGVPKNEHELLEEKYAKVQEEMVGFNEQVKKVQTDNVTLNDTVKKLKGEIKKLSEEKVAMKKENQKALAANKKLVAEKTKLLEEKKSAPEIGRDLGVCYSVVYNRLREYGIPIREPKDASKLSGKIIQLRISVI